MGEFNFNGPVLMFIMCFGSLVCGVKCICVVPSADALPGVLRWQSRLWALVTKLRRARQDEDVPNPSLLKRKEQADARKIWENKNFAVEQVECPRYISTPLECY